MRFDCLPSQTSRLTSAPMGHLRRVVQAGMLRSRDHFFGLGLTAIGLGLVLGLMR